MHRARLGPGRAGGLASSIQMGCLHVRSVLPGQWLSGEVSLAPPLAEWCDVIAEAGVELHWVGILCLLLRVLLS